ncbi:hypothetical protein D3C80_1218180 [compost metagenome]
MNVGWMKFPSHFSPKISSINFPFPMVSSTAIPMPRAASKISCSVFPEMSKPVYFMIASVIVTLAYGALKLTLCSPKVTSEVPFTSLAQ